MVALESKNQKQTTKAVKDVISACVLTEGFNVNELTLFDLEWVFLKLRSKSVGETTEIKVKCEECETQHDTEINLEDLEVTGLGEDDEDKIIQLTDTVGITMKYPSADDVEGISENELKSVKGVLKLIVNCMETIFDEDNVYPCKDETRKSVEEFLDSLNSAQFQKITQFFTKIPAITHDIEFTCTKCKHENKIELKGLQSFFS